MQSLEKYADLIPQELYEALSNESEVSIRKFVAKYTKSPSILTKLSNDASPNVLAEVAKNPNTPEEVLMTLSKDTRKIVLHSLAANPNIPRKALANIILTIIPY